MNILFAGCFIFEKWISNFLKVAENKYSHSNSWNLYTTFNRCIHGVLCPPWSVNGLRVYIWGRHFLRKRKLQRRLLLAFLFLLHTNCKLYFFCTYKYAGAQLEGGQGGQAPPSLIKGGHAPPLRSLAPPCRGGKKWRSPPCFAI